MATVYSHDNFGQARKSSDINQAKDFLAYEKQVKIMFNTLLEKLGREASINHNFYTSITEKQLSDAKLCMQDVLDDLFYENHQTATGILEECGE